jgi:aspartate aminotransferase
MSTPNKLSHLAETLIPSEIIKLGNEISERIRQGQTIYNFTIGDFDPNIFPIPQLLEDEIVNAYRAHRTNYPPANGIADLRQAVAEFLKNGLQLNYTPEEILISGGGRPLIYAAYRTICDRGEKVIYPVPSWNNNHYTHFIEGEHICVETKADNNFLPTAEELIPHFKDATLLALCSPLNPTGTVFTKDQLQAICQAVIDENKRRGDAKPLYILYDHIYWTLTYGCEHVNPVSLFPELKNYTIFIDGISKAFSATGVRVGWANGPAAIIDKMKGILSHIGAWSPMAEQVATAKYLQNPTAVKQHLTSIGDALSTRLERLFNGFKAMQEQGYPVDAIAPKASMYLTIRFSLKGKLQADGHTIQSTEDMTAFLLKEASLAIVPFAAFGADKNSEWYRLSVGTCKLEDIDSMFNQLKNALDTLK